MFSKKDSAPAVAKVQAPSQKSVPIAPKVASKAVAPKPLSRPVADIATKKVATPTKIVSAVPAAIQKQTPAPKKALPVDSKIQSKPIVTIENIKVPGIIPATSQIIYVQRFRSVLRGSLDPESFYKFLSTEVGKDITQAALPDIIRELPADKGKKLADAARK